MPERQWTGELPASTAELDEIIKGCTNAAEIRSKTLAYWAKQGIIAGGNEYAPQFVPVARTFSREVTLPNGRRFRVEGASSEQELEAMIEVATKARS